LRLPTVYPGSSSAMACPRPGAERWQSATKTLEFVLHLSGFRQFSVKLIL
jgi:hypothetical protein